MSDPNLITVFDKNGEPFETTRANARDLVNHVGWTYARPTVIEKIVEATPAPAPVVEEPAAPVAEEAPTPAVEEPAAEAAEEVAAVEAATVFTTAEEFEGLDRDGVVAYLAATFPDYQPHHRSGRDKLVEDAIKLAGE